MNCYFNCGLASQGICQQCGRSVCRHHSLIVDKKLTCFECAGESVSNIISAARNKIEKAYKLLPVCSANGCNIALLSDNFDDEKISNSFLGTHDRMERKYHLFFFRALGEDKWHIIQNEPGLIDNLKIQFPMSTHLRCKPNGCSLCSTHSPVTEVGVQRKWFSNDVSYTQCTCPTCNCSWKETKEIPWSDAAD